MCVIYDLNVFIHVSSGKTNQNPETFEINIYFHLQRNKMKTI